MRLSEISLALLCCVSGLATVSEAPGIVIKNVIVYRESGRYGGWPANHVIWQWGNEILVGFEAGYFKYNEKRHSIDWDRPAKHLLPRSLDGGDILHIEQPLRLRADDGTKHAEHRTEL